MNVKEAREKVERAKHLAPAIDDPLLMEPLEGIVQDFIKGRSFIEGYEQASKAAEPLLEMIQKYKSSLRKIVGLADSYGDQPMPESTYSCACEAREALSSCVLVVENYRKEVLGEEKQ